ncbi:hypothetical protein L596_016311 [Steinernema carpocapsae]|uniref:Uncharacterized protein n=1 Tax=Steinernema carpocapsae TaxID=34508 RepID=A0A4U5NHR1_STECR|nr:hypothetical protein L596_016311 [Steinernema carpocapsae]
MLKQTDRLVRLAVVKMIITAFQHLQRLTPQIGDSQPLRLSESRYKRTLQIYKIVAPPSFFAGPATNAICSEAREKRDFDLLSVVNQMFSIDSEITPRKSIRNSLAACLPVSKTEFIDVQASQLSLARLLFEAPTATHPTAPWNRSSPRRIYSDVTVVLVNKIVSILNFPHFQIPEMEQNSLQIGTLSTPKHSLKQAGSRHLTMTGGGQRGIDIRTPAHKKIPAFSIYQDEPSKKIDDQESIKADVPKPVTVPPKEEAEDYEDWPIESCGLPDPIDDPFEPPFSAEYEDVVLTEDPDEESERESEIFACFKLPSIYETEAFDLEAFSRQYADVFEGIFIPKDEEPFDYSYGDISDDDWDPEEQ